MSSDSDGAFISLGSDQICNSDVESYRGNNDYSIFSRDIDNKSQENLLLPLIQQETPITATQRVRQSREHIQHLYWSLPCQRILAGVNSCILILLTFVVVIDLWDLAVYHSFSNSLLSQEIALTIDWVVTAVLALEIFFHFAASRSSSIWIAIKSLGLDLLVLAASIASLAVTYAVEMNTVAREEAVAVLFILRIVRDAIRVSVALFFLRQVRETVVDFDRFALSPRQQQPILNNQNSNHEWSNDIYAGRHQPSVQPIASFEQASRSHYPRNSISSTTASSLQGERRPQTAIYDPYAFMHQVHAITSEPPNRPEDKPSEVVPDSAFYSIGSSPLSKRGRSDDHASNMDVIVPETFDRGSPSKSVSG